MKLSFCYELAGPASRNNMFPNPSHEVFTHRTVQCTLSINGGAKGDSNVKRKALHEKRLKHKYFVIRLLVICQAVVYMYLPMVAPGSVVRMAGVPSMVSSATQPSGECRQRLTTK